MKEAILEKIVKWAENISEVKGVALVGSHARNKTTKDSDIDIILLVDTPDVFISDVTWLKKIFTGITKYKLEQWGIVKTIRVFDKDNNEIELNFAPLSWANTDPVDSGTAKVLEGGIKILYDSDKLFNKLINSNRF